MQLSKNATGNLINRYKAVLKKCHLLNAFGSLAMAAMLCLGLAGGLALELGNPQGALAATVTDTSTDGSETNASGGNDTVSTDQSGNIVFGGRASTTNISFGGHSQSATANGNTLNITNTGIVRGAYGGIAQSLSGHVTSGTSDGGTGGAATANENTLNVEAGGIVNDVAYGGYAFSQGGAVSSGNGHGGAGGATLVTNNEINISGTVKMNAYGGSAFSKGGDVNNGNGHGGNAGTATANDNSLSVEVGSTVGGSAYGGDAFSRGGDVHTGDGNGGDVGTATANYNSLIIRGTVSSSAYGGYAFSSGGNAFGAGVDGNSGIATASYNTVLVEGATLGTAGNVHTGHIVGGVADGNANSSAENNTVTLSGAVNFLNTNNFVAGGLVQNPGYGLTADPHAFTGNTLNVERYAGDKIGTLGNFETYNFIVGDTVVNGGTLLDSVVKLKKYVIHLSTQRWGIYASTSQT